MFLLHFLPDSFLLWVINTVLLIGLVGTIAGFFLTFIPFVHRYKLIVQIISVVLLVAGVYFKGSYATEMEWRARVAELQAKIDAAEVKSKEVNTVIQERVVTKIKKVKEVQYKNKEVIKQVEHIINAECTVPKEAIDILNAAARNETAKEPK